MLKFKTIINATATNGLKRAVTNFGVTYELSKSGRHWDVFVTTPGYPQDTLATGVSYARAVKIANDAEAKVA